MTAMSRRDREDLQKVARMRAKLAKDGVAVREAELLADVEEQLAAKHAANHEAWAAVTARAEALVAEADREIAERCRELGIREEFRPRLTLGWWDRGENADQSRRAELRKVAQTQIAAAGRRAKTSINVAVTETALIAGGLESDAAREYLETIPTAAELMPAITIKALEQADSTTGKRPGVRG